ncbi:hypothetical protein ACNKHN_05175 [Shigella flexneri]
MDELKSQLADYQQAPDVQQRARSIDNQAIAALICAKELAPSAGLAPRDSAAQWLGSFQAKELEADGKNARQ